MCAALIPWPIEIDKMRPSNHRPLFVPRPYAKISMVNVADAYPTTKEKGRLWFQPKRMFLFRSDLGLVPSYVARHSPEIHSRSSGRAARDARVSGDVGEHQNFRHSRPPRNLGIWLGFDPSVYLMKTTNRSISEQFPVCIKDSQRIDHLCGGRKFASRKPKR